MKKKKEELEMKIWLDEKGDIQCHFKGNGLSMSECISTLMLKNETMRDIIIVAALGYQSQIEN